MITTTESILLALHCVDEDTGTSAYRDAVLDIAADLEARPVTFSGDPARQMALALLLGHSIGRRSTLQAELEELQATHAG